MKLTFTFLVALTCVLLLSSCVYYGVQRDFGGDTSAPCTNGSAKENDKCKADIKALNNEIKSAQ